MIIIVAIITAIIGSTATTTVVTITDARLKMPCHLVKMTKAL